MSQPPTPVPPAQPFPLEILISGVRSGARLSWDLGVRCAHGRHARTFLTWCRPPCFPRGPCHHLKLNCCCTEASRLGAGSAWAPVPGTRATLPNLISPQSPLACVTSRGKPNSVSKGELVHTSRHRLGEGLTTAPGPHRLRLCIKGHNPCHPSPLV